jgi:hypothetical protein
MKQSLLWRLMRQTDPDRYGFGCRDLAFLGVVRERNKAVAFGTVTSDAFFGNVLPRHLQAAKFAVHAICQLHDVAWMELQTRDMCIVHQATFRPLFTPQKRSFSL